MRCPTLSPSSGDPKMPLCSMPSAIAAKRAMPTPNPSAFADIHMREAMPKIDTLIFHVKSPRYISSLRSYI